jgi:hypothetical protein
MITEATRPCGVALGYAVVSEQHECRGTRRGLKTQPARRRETLTVTDPLDREPVSRSRDADYKRASGTPAQTGPIADGSTTTPVSRLRDAILNNLREPRDTLRSPGSREAAFDWTSGRDSTSIQ